MKNLHLSNLLILTLLFLSISCSKTEDGDEHCPEGYTGKNCDIQITPDSVIITKVKVLRFPASNIQDEDWDETSNADIYIQVWQNNEQIWSSTMIYANAISDTGIQYSFLPVDTIALTDPLSQYAIQLYDQDDDSEDDYMGGINFISYSHNNGFPELMILDDEGIVAFELNLEYNW